MEFHETLLAAQRNQQNKSSANAYYKARFDPPKKEKEYKPKDRLSANIQKFLAKREEEERQKQIDTKRKRDDLLAMRDPKAMRKIQKSLKVFKSANKSVLADAIDTENTAVTLDGPLQPDQDDYGYESQEAAAIYQKMMEKYSKIPNEPKFPTSSNSTSKKDIDGARERVKYALKHADDPVPHKRRRRTNNDEEKEPSPPPKLEVEKKKEDKPKVRRPMPPPMDFNELLKLAEQKKNQPLEVVAQHKATADTEPERPMTKKQRKEYEEEMARKMRRQQEMDRASGKKVVSKDVKLSQDRDKKPDGINKIPKLSDKDLNSGKNGRVNADSPKTSVKSDDREKQRIEKNRSDIDRERMLKEKARIEKVRNLEREINMQREKLNQDKERLDRLKMKQESMNIISTEKSSNYKGIDNKNREKMNSSKDNKVKQDYKNSIELENQNTYRIDKNSNNRKFVIPSKSSDSKYMNGHGSQNIQVSKAQTQPSSEGKTMSSKQKATFSNSTSRQNGGSSKTETGKIRVTEQTKTAPSKSRPDDRKMPPPTKSGKVQPSNSKPKISNSFDFDKHVNSLGKPKNNDGSRQFPSADDRRKQSSDDPRRKATQKRRVLDSDEDDSEMDDFIDDGDEELDYSTHIKEIFGYDRSKYRHLDDEDDRDMESSFARQMREEYVSKRIGIMEDLEDMRMEAMEKKIKSKKKRRIED